jgi:ADP-heptose:LPS heptosyltransferase
VQGKCLVIQEARLGDLIQTIPLLGDLSRSGYRTILLVRPGIIAAARGLSVADEVRAWPSFGDPAVEMPLAKRLMEAQSFVASLRRESFERVVVLNHHGTGVLLARLLGIPVSGFERMLDRKEDSGDSGLLFGWPGYLVASSRGIRGLNRIHLSDMWRGFGGRPPGPPPGRSKIQSAGPVAVVLGGRSPYRRWEPEAILSLVRHVRRVDGGEVVLTGGPEDEALGAFLEREGGQGVRNLAGKTDVEALRALLAGAGVVVSPDTAPLHLAASLGVPTVGLFFASALFFETGAYREGAVSVVPSMDCYPCAGEGASCPHRSCREAPGPEALAWLIAGVKRGEGGRDLVRRLPEGFPGAEIWEAIASPSGLLQRSLSPRELTRERILARLLRRFYWRYLSWGVDLPDLSRELVMEGGEDCAAMSEEGGNVPLSVWLSRLAQGVDLYLHLREARLGGTQREKLVDRLASDFPMMWPLLHFLEWVEGGEGPVRPLALAAEMLVLEAAEAARLVVSGREKIVRDKEAVHVAI